MGISFAHSSPAPDGIKDGVKIIWQGKRISRLVFASGKVVEFHEDPAESSSPRSSQPDRPAAAQ